LLGPRPEALPDAVLAEIVSFARDGGLDYESKPHGAALHSRGVPELEEHCALFMQDLAQSHGLAVKRGKRVAELVRPGADKGHAVREFLAGAPFAGSRPVFVGDDVTDEDGFAMVNALKGVSIRVGDSSPSQAQYRLANVAQVIQWLRALPLPERAVPDSY
jgi:trehalose 6-phosphate phosphatase